MAHEVNGHHAIVLAIAGFDPSGGAGVAADLKTIAAHNGRGVAAITALTVQNTQGVKRIDAVSGKLLAETLDALTEDIRLAAVKIGMLGSVENVRVTRTFSTLPSIPIFTAARRISSVSASSVSASNFPDTASMRFTPCVFCTVSAVIAATPRPLCAAMVLRSAATPAPPEGSKPAMASTIA